MFPAGFLGLWKRRVDRRGVRHGMAGVACGDNSPNSPARLEALTIRDQTSLIIILHSCSVCTTFSLQLDAGVTVAQVRITAAGRGPCREGAYETTASQRAKATEPSPDWLQCRTGTSGSHVPHGDARQGANIPHSSRASSGNPRLDPFKRRPGGKLAGASAQHSDSPTITLKTGEASSHGLAHCFCR